MLTNKGVSKLLKETASLIELTGGNEFRARAFSSAARTIERLDEPLSVMIEKGTLQNVRGIGAALSSQIEEILETGSFELYEELYRSIPPGLTEILRVKGLGAKKVRRIWTVLGITSLKELEEAAMIGRLADLDGFGLKTQENVLANIVLLKEYGSKRKYAQAVQEAAPVLDRIRKTPGVVDAEFAGDLRRKLEIVSEAVFVAASDDVEAACIALSAGWTLEPGMGDAHGILTGKLPGGLEVAIHAVPTGRFGTFLWNLTGSDGHIQAFESRFGPPPAVAQESEVYERAGLSYIEPELREGLGELEAARSNALPILISEEDLRGTLHNHSTFSDGAHTIRQMVSAARAMGYSYYGVCDHSRSLAIANGLSIDRVRAQQEEIDTLNRELAESDGPPFQIFKGTESDILEDGSLDYPVEVLNSFDFVVASIHQRFRMTKSEATVRLVKAIENPYTTILGHPTGRLLLRREGYPIDHEKIIDACAANDVVIEINSNPNRLDLDWRWIRHALDRGIMLSINPDAHSIDELSYMRWGTAVARKGWLTPDRCLNAKSLESFAAWIEERKTRRVGISSA